jgi:hypothetical protein
MPLSNQYLLKIAVIGAAGLTLGLAIIKPAQAVSGGLTLGDPSNTQDSGASSTDSDSTSLPSFINSAIAQTIISPSGLAVTQVAANLSADSQDSTSTSAQLTASAVETAPSGSSPSSEAVPEPLTVAGTLLGGAFVWRMRKKLAKNLES